MLSKETHNNYIDICNKRNEKLYAVQTPWSEFYVSGKPTIEDGFFTCIKLPELLEYSFLRGVDDTIHIMEVSMEKI